MIRSKLPRRIGDLSSIHAVRQPDIGNEKINSRARLQHTHSGRAVPRFDTGIVKNLGNQHPDRRLVVDDQCDANDQKGDQDYAHDREERDQTVAPAAWSSCSASLITMDALALSRLTAVVRFAAARAGGASIV
jgi:hypothetical protein